MLRPRRTWLAALVLLAAACAGPSAPLPGRKPAVPGTADLAGPVVRVRDGDTFCLPDACIRLWGVDAPERAQAGGAAATRALEALISGTWVHCRALGRSYDRTVCTCRDQAGQDVAGAMVERGWAWDWPKYSHGHYAAVQEAARAARRGIWGLW